MQIVLELLQPGALELPAPDADETRLVYRVRGMSEAALHGFARSVPVLGHAMANSALPPGHVERLAAIVAAVAKAMEDGRIEAHEVAEILGAALASPRVARIASALAGALADGRITGAELMAIMAAAA